MLGHARQLCDAQALSGEAGGGNAWDRANDHCAGRESSGAAIGAVVTELTRGWSAIHTAQPPHAPMLMTDMDHASVGAGGVQVAVHDVGGARPVIPASRIPGAGWCGIFARNEFV